MSKKKQKEERAIRALVDLMLQTIEAGSVDYCCRPVNDDACSLELGHKGTCKSYLPQI